MSKIKQVSRKDVAKQAGVSVTTVTHALNNTPGTRINKETVEKVKKAAKELGYRPNFVGRALVTGKTFSVGLLQPSHESMFIEFYQHMILGMVQAMEKDDYNLVIMFRSSDHRYLKPIRQGRLDGVIILQSDFKETYIDKVVETKIPTVVVNKKYNIANKSYVGCVHSDHHLLMKESIDELVTNGCKSIMAIHDPRACDANKQMFDAFTNVIEDYSPKGIIGTTLIISDRESLKNQIRNIFNAGQKWDGIFVDGPHYTEIVMQEAKKHGLEHGRDYLMISSSCYDGECTPSRSELSAYTHQPEVIGHQSWDIMKNLIHGESCDAYRTVPYKRYEINKLKLSN